MMEIGKWALALVAWLAAILIIASIDTFKDLKHKRRLGEDIVVKSKHGSLPETQVGARELQEKSA